MTVDIVTQYLNMTGQTEQDLYAGLQQYGPDHINNLVAQALKDKKKIVFVPELTDGQDLGQGDYIMEDLKA